MIRRLFTVIALGAVLSAAPAIGKSKAPVVVAPAAPVLSAIVDPDPTHDPAHILALDLSNGGRVLIRLMPVWAPKHIERIETLTKQGFYNNVVFHRVIDGFMAQTGDPKGTGEGGSPLPDLQAEFNMMPHVRGAVSMARTDDPNSANSQFFIVFYPHFALDHKYTVFGRVISGMQFADAIERGEPPANPTRVVQASLLSEGKPKPALVAPVAVPAAIPPIAAAPAAFERPPPIPAPSRIARKRR